MMRRIARSPARSLLIAGTAACALAALSSQVQAQGQAQSAVVSQPVVQPTTGSSGGASLSPSQALNSALTRLARDPRNLTALLDAGAAALQLGDTDAAIGFFTRANEVAPGNGQVKAQIGAVLLKADQPLDAIRTFDEAERAGADLSAMAADRGLAYDLVGDNAAAQRFYQSVLGRGQNDEVLRRYALSLAIAGDRRSAEATIAPLVQRQDRAAWRARTFIMAITGNPDEAVSVAYASMPQDLAAGIAPYLRFMGRLTPAQQAAAANLGRFPRAADIGRDDARIVQYAALHPRAPKVDATLIPAGEALGGKAKAAPVSRDKRRRPDRDQPQGIALAAATPTLVAAPLPPPPPPPPPPVASQPVRVAVASPPPSAAPAPAPSVTTSFDLARAPGTQTQAQMGQPAPYPLARIDMPPGAPVRSAAPSVVPVAPPAVPQPVSVRAVRNEVPPPADFRALFEGFKAPEEEQQTRVAAVDVAAIRAARAEPKPAAKDVGKDAPKSAKAAPVRPDPRGERPDGPTAVSRTTDREVRVAEADAKGAKQAKGAKDTKTDAKVGRDAKTAKSAKAEKAEKAKPSHPSRIWVQVLSGGNREVMGKEWRRLVKDAAALKGRKPYISPWRNNFRLLTGPFESDAAAQDFVRALKKADVSSYQWTSPAGQPVDTLSLD